MAQVRIYIGQDGESVRGRLTEVYRASPRPVLFLLPTRALAQEWARHLCHAPDISALWMDTVVQLTDYAEHLLRGAGIPVCRLEEHERLEYLLHAVKQVQNEGASALLEAALTHEGVLRHLLRLLTDIKQAAILPEEFQRRARRALQKSTDAAEGTETEDLLARVYHTYQVLLTRDAVYDIPGLYWRATEYLTEKKPSGLCPIVFLDSFEDFTPSEFRFVSALLQYAAEAHVGLLYSADPDRRDLFTLTQQTLAQWQRIQTQHGHTVIVEECPDTPVHTRSTFVARALFGRNAPQPPANPVAENVTLTAYLTPSQEWEEVGRTIKSLLRTEKAQVGDIVIVHRSPSTIALGLSSIMQELGVPLTLHTQLPLARTALGRFIKLFCELATSWNVHTFLEWLTSPYCRAQPWFGLSGYFQSIALRVPPSDSRHDWEQHFQRMVRAASCAAETGSSEEGDNGRNALISGETQAGDKTTDEVAQVRHVSKSLSALLDALAFLKTAQAQFEERGTIAEYCRVLADLLCTWKSADTAGALSPLEKSAFERLDRFIGQWAHAAFATEETTRVDFFRILSRLLDDLGCPLPSASNGVLCTDPTHLRGRRFSYVFLLSLNEGIFPASPSRNVVLSREEMEALVQEGIALPGRDEQIARERLLLYHVCAAATKELHVSYCLVKEGRREASPSFYFEEIKDILNAVESTQGAVRARTSFIQSLDNAACARDVLNALFLHDAQAQIQEKPAWRDVYERAQIERSRYDSTELDEFDGKLCRPETVTAIQQAFSEEYLWSAHQLATYLECPFAFFQRYVLGVEEPEEISTVLVDARVLGEMLHGFLHRLHTAFARKPLAEIPDEILNSTAQEIAHVLTEETYEKYPYISLDVIKVEMQRILKQVQRYFAVEKEEGREWRPAFFEVAFGKNTEEPVLQCPAILDLGGSMGRIQYCGRIDRIDLRGQQVAEASLTHFPPRTEIRLVDYKLGQAPSAKAIKNGNDFQLYLYARAIEQYVKAQEACVTACYIPFKELVKLSSAQHESKRGTPYRYVFGGPSAKAPSRATIEKKCDEQLRRILDAMRSGYFAPTPAENERCMGCFRTRACRFVGSRIQRKDATPIVLQEQKPTADEDNATDEEKSVGAEET